MANELELTVESEHGSHVTLRVSGELDAATAPQLREKLHELVGQLYGVIVLDLGPVDFIDSSALGVILSAWKLMKAQDGALVIVSPHPRITRIFEITGLTLSISVCETVEEALAAADSWRHPAGSGEPTI